MKYNSKGLIIRGRIILRARKSFCSPISLNLHISSSIDNLPSSPASWDLPKRRNRKESLLSKQLTFFLNLMINFFFAVT